MSKPARSRIKNCEHCNTVSSTLYRVVTDKSGTWVLICDTCRMRAEGRAEYRYGGTWKSDKRH